MTRTLAAKVIAGIHSQRWTLSGYGGTWTGAMRPLEEYVKRKVERAVKAEREACAEAVAAEREMCARVCDGYADNSSHPMNFAINCADAIRARGNK